MRPTRIVSVAVVVGAMTSFQSAFAQPCEAAWGDAFLGFPDPGDVAAAAFYDDGSGPALYIGGALEGQGVVGRVDDGRVEILPGLFGGVVGVYSALEDLIVHDDGSGPALYAAGHFSLTPGGPSAGVARWRDGAWEFVGTPMRTAYALAVFDEDGDGPLPARLFAGGFNGLGALGGLERWDGAAWTSVGAAIGTGLTILSLAVIDDGTGEALYVAGDFPTIAGLTANSVGRWDGAAWSVLGNGLPLPAGQPYSARVSELAWHDDGDGGALYAGGFFNADLNGVIVRNLARWRDGAWSGLGIQQFTNIEGMVSVGGELLLAGRFNMQGNGVPSVLVRLRDGALERLPGEPTIWPTAENAQGNGVIAWENGALVFGEFDRVNDGDLAVDLAIWDGEAMAPYMLQRGLNVFATGLALAVDPEGGAMGVGGQFYAAGGLQRSCAALFDGVGWSSLGEGLNDQVGALAMHDDGEGARLYAGGAFTASGEVDLANSVAVFDGESWERFAALNMGEAMSIASIGGDLYVGGNFSSIEGTAAQRIARWDGMAWQALGAGLNGSLAQVMTIVPWAGGVAVGGSFTNSAGQPLRNVAFWDGEQWTPIGEGLNFRVSALAEYAGELYAAGEFTQTGAGAPARYVARWDGVSWRGLPGFLSAPASALRVYDDGTGPALFVGGSFGRIDLEVFGSIARWDGAAWSKLGTGLNGPVRALAVQEIDGRPSLVATGAFFSASGVPSFGLAEWRGCLAACPGDVDGDGMVSMIDLMRVVDAFNTTESEAAYNADADFDGSGAVDFEDLNRVLAAFNMDC